MRCKDFSQISRNRMTITIAKLRKTTGTVGECSLLSLQLRQLPEARIKSGLSLRLYSRSNAIISRIFAR